MNDFLFRRPGRTPGRQPAGGCPAGWRLSGRLAAAEAGQEPAIPSPPAAVSEVASPRRALGKALPPPDVEGRRRAAVPVPPPPTRSGQSLYNLLTREIELEVLPAARAYGVGVIPWSPLQGGLLGGALKKEREGRRRQAGRA
jgi:hypothetical protein